MQSKKTPKKNMDKPDERTEAVYARLARYAAYRKDWFSKSVGYDLARNAVGSLFSGKALKQLIEAGRIEERIGASGYKQVRVVRSVAQEGR